MSKFAPKTVAKPAQPPSDEAIDRAIAGAAPDAPPAEKTSTRTKDLTFSMSLPPEMADAVDASCARLGLTRTAWLRLAAAEKLGWK